MSAQKSVMRLTGIVDSMKIVEDIADARKGDKIDKVGKRSAFDLVVRRLNKYQGAELEQMITAEKVTEDEAPIIRKHITKCINIVEMMSAQMTEELVRTEGETRAFDVVLRQITKIADSEKAKANRLIDAEQKIREGGEEAFLDDETGNPMRYAKLDKNRGRKTPKGEPEEPAPKVEIEAKAEEKPKRTRKSTAKGVKKSEVDPKKAL